MVLSNVKKAHNFALFKISLNKYNMRSFTLSLLMTGSVLSLNAQTAIQDSVEMGAGYANEVYYKLEDGQKLATPANNWHIGFKTDSYSATIISNAGLPSPGMGEAAMAIYKYPNGTNADFETVDTTGISNWTAVYDDSISFDMGAFNQGATGHPNYGWGNYNMANHQIVGNSVYVIKVETSTYKIDFVKKALGTITFRYALVGETSGTEVNIALNTTYPTKEFVFFNLETGEVVDKEMEDWDLWAVKYIDYYNGTIPNQSVTGILTNPKWKVAKINVGSESQESHFDVSNGTFSTNKNVIGQSYKALVNNVWQVTSDEVYYLQNTNGDIWKWYPTKFVGIGAGKTVFMKEKMATAGLESTGIQFVEIYPNPSSDAITIVFDSKGSNVDFIVRNQMGQIVLQETANTNSGVSQQKLNISALTNGMYFVEVNQNGNAKVQSIIKK